MRKIKNYKINNQILLKVKIKMLRMITKIIKLFQSLKKIKEFLEESPKLFLLHMKMIPL